MDDQSKLELPPEPQRHLRLATAERQGDAPSLITQAEPPIDGGHLLDYVRVLYKRRWIAATAFVVVVVSVTLYTFTVTPTFEATTRLLIESDNPNVVNFAEVIDEQGTKADYYQTQYNILQSRGLARKTLEQLKLWDNEHFKDAASGGWFGSNDAPTGEAAAAGETLEQSRAIDRFLEGLTVTPIRNSRLVDVKYRLSDAELAARLVNSVAKNYIEQNLEYKFLASKEASDWLGERLAEQRRQVETAEAALQRYREQNDAISVADRENIVVQKLADLNAAVTRAKTERFQKEALYKQLQALAKDGSPLDSFPAILTNSYIQQQKAELSQLQTQYAQLSDKLGDKHPDIIKVRSAIDLVEKRLSGEIAKVVESVRSEYQAALAQENSLVGALNQQKGVAMAMNRKAIDYGVLERDVEGSRQMYQSLMQRAKETGVSSELKTSNIRIVDAAERPNTPVSPRRALNFTLAILGGAVLAFGLAFFFEYVDSRIKSPDEIRAHLGLPSLGMIPVVDPKVGKGLEPLISNGVPPNFAEAFRALRTNVLFSSAAEGARHLVITSTGPGEGKTMVAANLAIGLAQAGQRVLLIDADMRRPRVHEVFRQKQEPGLSNLMVGHTVPSACIRKSNVQGLWLLTGGRIPPNPAELLGSRRFKDFVHSLSDHFDSVIIDSPPAMAVTDAAIAASIATGVIFVVGSEMTSRHAARTALQQLQNGRCPFLGVVLNRVDLERNAYYYSHYYRREYAQYYVAAR
jgi:succinoglycan biosynthesis transport protein ExoP